MSPPTNLLSWHISSEALSTSFVPFPSLSFRWEEEEERDRAAHDKAIQKERGRKIEKGATQSFRGQRQTRTRTHQFRASSSSFLPPLPWPNESSSVSPTPPPDTPQFPVSSARRGIWSVSPEEILHWTRAAFASSSWVLWEVGRPAGRVTRAMGVARLTLLLRPVGSYLLLFSAKNL